MLKVYLLRHGQTPWNADNNRYCGRTDLPLTEKGLKQAAIVAEQLKDIRIDAVYSSPLQRASETARIASGGKEVNTDERLIEADFGAWENKTREEFILENEDLWNNWMKDPANSAAGGTGETGRQIIDRVDNFFQSMIAQHPNGKIMVVAHNGVNRLYLAEKLGMPLSNYRKLIQENSTVTVFELDEDGELTLVHLNSKM